MPSICLAYPSWIFLANLPTISMAQMTSSHQGLSEVGKLRNETLHGKQNITGTPVSLAILGPFKALKGINNFEYYRMCADGSHPFLGLLKGV